MTGDEVTIGTLRRHAYVIGLLRACVDTDDLGTLDEQIVGAAGSPRHAHSATVITAMLIFELVSAGFPRCRLHEILNRIQADYERDFFAFQLGNIEAWNATEEK